MLPILADCSASISELKRNPTALIRDADGSAVAILNHNKPAAYLVPTETFEWLVNQLDDQALAEIVRERMADKDDAIEVSLDAL